MNPQRQPNPEHVAAGAALRRMDEARDRLARVANRHYHGRATTAEVDRAHDAYNAAVAAYYEEQR